MEEILKEKFEATLAWFRGYPEVAVAYSGGVDSTLVLALAVLAIGNDRVLALTADSPSIARQELKEAKEYAASLGTRHIIFKTKELEDQRYQANDKDRCYYCKSTLFTAIPEQIALISAKELKDYVLVDGTNFDDLGDERPGRRAAQELGIRSPLMESKITKLEAREISRSLSLATWDKPEMACLASRITRGTTVTLGKLSIVEKAEAVLSRLGCLGARVRLHELKSNVEQKDCDLLARIELQFVDIKKFGDLDFREQASKELKDCGFSYVTLDLEGYRKGGRKISDPEIS